MARRGGSVWLREHYGPSCEPKTVQVEIGDGVSRAFDHRTAEAWQAYAAVVKAVGYVTRSADTGTYVCRLTASGYPSPHSWATALDHNWLTNPATGGVYGGPNRVITDMPREMIDGIKAIRTKGGQQVFGWGGDYSSFKDAMHFEVIATPAELAQGIDWSTVQAKPRDPSDPKSYPTLRQGDSGPAVADLQVRLINDAKIHVEGGADGNFGPGTHAAVLIFQESRGLTADGIVGLQTWTHLLANSPVLQPGDAGPVKDQPAAPDFATGVVYGRGFPADERAARALAGALHLAIRPHDTEQTFGTVYLVGGHAVREFDRSQADDVIERAAGNRAETWDLVSADIKAYLSTL